MINIGEQIRVPLVSTSGRLLRVIANNMTAQINNEDRVHAAVAVDKDGEIHAIVCIDNKEQWKGIHHRMITSCREWEDANGDLISGDVKRLVDQAIANKPK